MVRVRSFRTEFPLRSLPMPSLEVMPAVFSVPPNLIGGRRLRFVLNYNGWNDGTGDGPDRLGDFFTIAVWRPPASRMRDHLLTEKLVYARDTFKPHWHVPELRGIRLVPMDMRMKEGRITRENFGRSVFLYYNFDPLARVDDF